MFILKFHNINKGQYSETYTIRSNDPDEDPFYLNATALSFAPNYMLIQNAEAFVEDTVTLKIDVNNYEPFVNFQVDLDFPDSLTFVPNSAMLTNRKQDPLVFEALLTPNKLRLFTFTQNQLPFLGDTGTVVTINFVVGNDTGTFPLHLSQAVLSDANSQNLIRGTFDGQINVKPVPTFQLSVTLANGWNMVSIPGLHPTDQNVNTWWAFRDLGANVFRYAGGYQSVTTAVPGTGYWMKHTGARTYNTGDQWPAGGIQIVPHAPLTAASGWNLFGGYELVVTAANVTTNPPGLQSVPIYKYARSRKWQNIN